jgi:hypothetical protein
VTETRTKTAVKTPYRKINNLASTRMGGSLLKNMEVEAAIEMQQLLHLAEVCTEFAATLQHLCMKATFYIS